MKRLFALLLACMLPCMALAESAAITNPNLETWCAAYDMYYLGLVKDLDNEDGDSVLLSPAIRYTPDALRESAYGDPIADSRFVSERATYAVTLSTGTDDDALWSASFAFGRDAREQDIVTHGMAAVLACMPLGLYLGEGAQIVETMQTILGALIGSEAPIAIEAGDVVFSAAHADGALTLNIQDEYYFETFEDGSIETMYQLY